MDKLLIHFDSDSMHNGMQLPDISYEKFLEFLFESGSSDIEYDNYLRENKMTELTNFSKEGVEDLTLIVEHPYRGRVLKFKCVYDSDNDKNFDEVKYFGTNI